jgi:hypothetical protein
MTDDQQDLPATGDAAPGVTPSPGDAVSAELETALKELAASRAEAGANFAAAREALKAGNPGLPEAAFEGDSLAVVNERVSLAREAATAAAEAARSGAAAQVPAGGGTQRAAPAGPPEGTRGLDRIRYGIEQLRNK